MREWVANDCMADARLFRADSFASDLVLDYSYARWTTLLDLFRELYSHSALLATLAANGTSALSDVELMRKLTGLDHAGLLGSYCHFERDVGRCTTADHRALHIALNLIWLPKSCRWPLSTRMRLASNAGKHELLVLPPHFRAAVLGNSYLGQVADMLENHALLNGEAVDRDNGEGKCFSYDEEAAAWP